MNRQEQPSKFEQWKQMQKENIGLQPWEKAHFKGMARQGLAELRAAFYPESNIAQPTDYGIFGRSTPGETADQRSEEPTHRNTDEEKSIQANSTGRDSGTSWGRLDQRMQELQSDREIEPVREEPELEK